MSQIPKVILREAELGLSHPTIVWLQFYYRHSPFYTGRCIIIWFHFYKIRLRFIYHVILLFYGFCSFVKNHECERNHESSRTWDSRMGKMKPMGDKMNPSYRHCKMIPAGVNFGLRVLLIVKSGPGSKLVIPGPPSVVGSHINSKISC